MRPQNMIDTYKNFKELSEYKKEGLDFTIEMVNRESSCVVIAIHGGNIELGTTEIARAIAGEELSFYSFIGKGTEQECKETHITSTNFDEPKCNNLVSKSLKTLSIHGEGGVEDYVMVGGLDYELIEKISDALKIGGFIIKTPSERINGNAPQNICNKCSSGAGIQLEISRGLRNKLLENPLEFSKFCKAIRSVIVF